METIRKTVRKWFSWNSKTYRVISICYNRIYIGIYTRLRGFKFSQENNENVTFCQQFLTYKDQFHYRNNKNDRSVITNNLFRKEYGFRGIFQNFDEIIDAGGYIGDTSFFFLSKSNVKRVHVYEPDKNSLILLKINLRPFEGRYIIYPSALTYDGRRIGLKGNRTGLKVTAENTEFSSFAFSEALMRVSEKSKLLVKLDIEGEEGNIFSKLDSVVLRRVECYIIETHGTDVDKIVKNRLEKLGYHWQVYRNLVYAMRY